MPKRATQMALVLSVTPAVSRYDASGAPQGPGFQVNSYTTGSQRVWDVAFASSGGFVVTWESFGQDGGQWAPGAPAGLTSIRRTRSGTSAAEALGAPGPSHLTPPSPRQ